MYIAICNVYIFITHSILFISHLFSVPSLILLHLTYQLILLLRVTKLTLHMENCGNQWLKISMRPIRKLESVQEIYVINWTLRYANIAARAAEILLPFQEGKNRCFKLRDNSSFSCNVIYNKNIESLDPKKP